MHALKLAPPNHPSFFRIALSLWIIGALFFSAAGSALASPPGFPSSFWGQITITDSAPQIDDLVQAYVTGAAGPVSASAVEEFEGNLVYNINVIADDTDTPAKDGGLEGDEIIFMINGRVVAKAVWHGGTNVELPFHPPDPALTHDGPINEGGALNLDASTSADAGADIATYAFDCANDGVFEIGPQAGATAACTYADNGVYTIAVKLVDAQGGEGVDTIQATVNNVAPTVTATGAAAVYEGSVYTLNLSATGDPGADTIASWTVNWGDGVEDALTGNPSSAAHTYADGPNNYTINASATDEDGTYAATGLAVTVNNVAPTALPGGPYSGAEGSPITLNGGGSDPGDDALTYAWDLDNNSTYETSGQTTTFTGPDDGTYTVGLQVTDSDGATGAATVNINITNANPIANANGDYTVDEGATITLNGTATDPAGALDTLSFAWDLDENPDFETSGQDVAFSQPDEGSFVVTLQVTDEDGGVDTDSATVTVNNVAPTANAGGPYTGTAGEPVALTASATDPGVNDVLTYNWDLDNDGQYDDATGSAASVTFYTMGSHPVGVQVSDGDGGTHTAGATVTISGATHALDLQPGWNLVSFNVIPTSDKPVDILAGIEGDYDLVYAWDAQVDEWKKFDNIADSPDSLTALTNLQGFWIHITAAEPTTLSVVGSVPTTADTIALSAAGSGWNLVGYPTAATQDLPGVFTANGAESLVMVYAFHANDPANTWKLYDPSGPAYSNDLTALDPGWGYWVKVSADEIWTVDYTP